MHYNLRQLEMRCTLCEAGAIQPSCTITFE